MASRQGRRSRCAWPSDPTRGNEAVGVVPRLNPTLFLSSIDDRRAETTRAKPTRAGKSNNRQSSPADVDTVGHDCEIEALQYAGPRQHQSPIIRLAECHALRPRRAGSARSNLVCLSCLRLSPAFTRQPGRRFSVVCHLAMRPRVPGRRPHGGEPPSRLPTEVGTQTNRLRHPTVDARLSIPRACRYALRRRRAGAAKSKLVCNSVSVRPSRLLRNHTTW